MMFGAVPARRNVVATVVSNDVFEELQQDNTDVANGCADRCETLANDARNDVAKGWAVFDDWCEPAADPATVAREAAVASFVAGMGRVTPGVMLPFSVVRTNYREIGAGIGWPPLSDKALSGLLVANGCTKIHPSQKGYPRKRHQSRPVLFVMPDVGPS